ncbi:SGNH/GDSL hydrolase family protein [Paenibacillus glycanilyticus]|uniref:SGNH hydrolase-type esterase domain-containing protein n=1 Tax=Paenibacillus glycanilyticus TaxID=126569 RepID=A0ABQ6G6S4_9BACL|nr:SGNH/GDSL hydrolase family protein [Paenibacillus glycanilyticus]GLX66688.1 hypothetical protein MU1_10320 [Paenibacillus glycanilyticus]
MKRTIKIACLGDSMTAFWGQEMPELKHALASRFPQQPFELLNYGVSGTRAEYGIYRLTHDFPSSFGDPMQKCLSSASPDIVVVESFAYNHRLDGAEWVDNYKNVLQELIATIRQTMPAQILFLVTIPPDVDHFLDHVPTYKDVHIDLRRKWGLGSETYLQAAVDFATSAGLPLINVYDLVKEKVAGGTPIRWFIDQNDHIHPSRYTYELVAEQIASAIKQHKFIQSGSESE